MHSHPWMASCHTQAAVDADAVPSVFAVSCIELRTDGADTAAKIAGPPSEDNMCVRLIVLLRHRRL